MPIELCFVRAVSPNPLNRFRSAIAYGKIIYWRCATKGYFLNFIKKWKNRHALNLVDFRKAMPIELSFVRVVSQNALNRFYSAVTFATIIYRTCATKGYF